MPLELARGTLQEARRRPNLWHLLPRDSLATPMAEIRLSTGLEGTIKIREHGKRGVTTTAVSAKMVYELLDGPADRP
jgi:hypothetical protein